MFDRVEIPYGCYWPTPFVRWQGALQRLHAIKFAAHVARREFNKRSVDPKIFAAGVLGMSIYRKRSGNDASPYKGRDTFRFCYPCHG